MAEIQLDEVTKRFDDQTAVDALTLRVEEGEFMILVGPSGCGKTTALRMIAGLEQVSSGEIRIGERVVNDVAPSDRDIAMVFQNYALYPHMSVRENIRFPLRKRKLSRGEKEKQVRDVARLLAIEELLDRKPRELSGGQRQRVAMGRAIIRHPRAFLMDEPLSNLDAKLRVQMRAELGALHRRLGVTTVYVTHDQTEAMTLGERVAVMNKGRLQQVDAPQSLYRHPANMFVAGFIGTPSMNFLRGRLEGDTVRLGRHAIPLPDEVTRRVAERPAEIVVGLRPEDLVWARPGSSESLDATVEIVEELGSEVLAYVRIEGLDVVAGVGEQPHGLERTITARLDGGSAVAPGQRVALAVRADRVHLFEPTGGRSVLDRGRAGATPAARA
jgi:multiple sugar transport system ATP-binding protein